MKIDAKDSDGIWCEAIVKSVLKLEKKHLVYVHYERWDNFFDELIPADSPRLAPLGTFTQRKILRYNLLLPDGNREGEVIK